MCCQTLHINKWKSCWAMQRPLLGQKSNIEIARRLRDGIFFFYILWLCCWARSVGFAHTCPSEISYNAGSGHVRCPAFYDPLASLFQSNTARSWRGFCARSLSPQGLRVFVLFIRWDELSMSVWTRPELKFYATEPLNHSRGRWDFLLWFRSTIYYDSFLKVLYWSGRGLQIEKKVRLKMIVFEILDCLIL